MLGKKQVTEDGMEETTGRIHSWNLVQLYSDTSVRAQREQGHRTLPEQQLQHKPGSRTALGCHGSSLPRMAARTALWVSQGWEKGGGSSAFTVEQTESSSSGSISRNIFVTI